MLFPSLHRNSHVQPFRGWVLVSYMLTIGIAVDAALLLSVSTDQTLAGAVATAVSAVLISAGGLFTVLTMVRLGKSDEPEE